MAHLVTWPDLFTPGETYIPFCWDMADFEEILSDVLQDEKKRLHVAMSGQKKYKEYMSAEGMGRLVKHFVSQING